MTRIERQLGHDAGPTHPDTRSPMTPTPSPNPSALASPQDGNKNHKILRWPMLSIRSTVLIAIAAAVLAPTLILWHLEQRLTRQAQQPLIDQNRQAVLVMTANALVEPMWSLDDVQMRRVAQRALNDPSVLSLRLTERRPLAAPIVLVRGQLSPSAACR